MLPAHQLRPSATPGPARDPDGLTTTCASVCQDLRHAEDLFSRALVSVQLGLRDAALQDFARGLIVHTRAALIAATAADQAASAGTAELAQVLTTQVQVLLAQLPGRIRLALLLCGEVPAAPATLLAVSAGIVRRSLLLRTLLGEARWATLLAELHAATIPGTRWPVLPRPLVCPAPGSGEGIPLAVLSPRERQVLALLSEGLTNREIGVRLGVKGITVNTFVSRIFTKLGVENRAAAAAYAVRHGVAMN
jgi:DNA-binding CsgD family transcriptional regulator